MLNIFRTNQLLFSVFLLAYAALLHVGVLFELGSPPAPPNGALSAFVWPYLIAQPTLPPLVALLLLFFQAWLLNVYVHRHRLAPEINLFAGLFLIMAGSAVPEFLNLTPYHFANFFLILALFNLTATYKVPSAADRIFNTGFWIGMATLFQADYLWMLLAAVAGLGILRARRVREILMVLSGAFLPLFFAGFGYFWFNQWPQFLQVQFYDAYSLPYQAAWPSELEDLIGLGLLAGILIVVLVRYSRYSFKMVIDVQKKIDLLFWLLLAGGLATLSTPFLSQPHWLIVLVPVGLCLGLLFTYLPRRTAEAVHLVLLVVILFLQLWPLAV